MNDPEIDRQIKREQFLVRLRENSLTTNDRTPYLQASIFSSSFLVLILKGEKVKPFELTAVLSSVTGSFAYAFYKKAPVGQTVSFSRRLMAATFLGIFTGGFATFLSHVYCFQMWQKAVIDEGFPLSDRETTLSEHSLNAQHPQPHFQQPWQQQQQQQQQPFQQQPFPQQQPLVQDGQGWPAVGQSNTNNNQSDKGTQQGNKRPWGSPRDYQPLPVQQQPDNTFQPNLPQTVVPPQFQQQQQPPSPQLYQQPYQQQQKQYPPQVPVYQQPQYQNYQQQAYPPYQHQQSYQQPAYQPQYQQPYQNYQQQHYQQQQFPPQQRPPYQQYPQQQQYPNYPPFGQPQYQQQQQQQQQQLYQQPNRNAQQQELNNNFPITQESTQPNKVESVIQDVVLPIDKPIDDSHE